MGRRVGTCGARSWRAVLLVPLLFVAACGGGEEDSSAEEVSEAATTVPPAPTTTPTTTSTTAPTTTTTTIAPATTPAPTTTQPPTTLATTTTSTAPAADDADPAATCAASLGQLGELLAISADLLLDGVDLTGELVDGTLTESDAAPLLAELSDGFATLEERLARLGVPPDSTRDVTALFEQQLAAYVAAYDLQSQGAATGDAALIDAGADELVRAADLSEQIAASMPDCSTAGTAPTGPTDFAVPEEQALTIFFRLAESTFTATDSPYAGTTEDVLVASAQASCRVLLDGGDTRAAIEAAIAASPVAGQSFGAAEQQYVLLVVTRGVDLWCPGAVGDVEAFTEDVISTIVDVFFDG